MKINFKNKWKIKHKLFISYIAVIMIPLMILGIYSYQQSKQLQVQQSNIVLQDSLKKMEDSLTYKLQRFNAAIELISYNPNFSHIFNEEYKSYYDMYIDLQDTVDPLLNTALFLNSDIARITIYTENNLTERMNSIMPISKVEHEFWYKESLNSADTHWYAEEGKIFGVRRIFGDINYDKKNLIYMELIPEFFFNSLKPSELNGSTVVITDPQMNIVYASDDSQAQLAAVRQLLQQSKQKPNTENSQYIWLNRTMKESGWTISLIASSEALTIKPWKIIRATIIIEAACFVILLGMIWLFTRVFVRRIHRLNTKMRMVEEGIFTISLKVHSQDEIGELELRFVKMLTSINLLIEEGYKSKIIQREAELRALQSQINPHFLYNSLSIINWKAIEIKATDISNVAGTLATFYRTTLNSGNDTMSVRDELLNTTSYLEMQLIMHDHDFDVIYELEDEILDYRMIKLVLQPIVENAIEHGIDQKRSGKGELRISGRLDGEAIVFTVHDNGPGMDKKLSEDILVKQSKGYGIYNVQERIRVQYGNEYGIAIQSVLGVGTEVTVRISSRLQDDSK
ncbi:two-component system sensor histidine kinase YesM [Paenibacillus endophyticus]|uniref:Two-component system sensor histidine kinase YesM n=1 Tax=Paenibacillus endophyticus TaxID=1294268 RepID=A0A7W5C3F0_9BACL|nr:histidine kinase [Paenibacillus endophyticus]MBB3150512.1 two-component system sensor histidine kinase YesM [Paenibacillus endophyticus]